MTIDTVLDEIKSIIRSINWYLKRNKQYDTAQFNTWKKNNATAEAAITTALTTFTFDVLVVTVEDFFKYKDTNILELDNDEKYFLANFEDIELFMINEELCKLKNTHKVEEDISTCFQKINLNVNITMECLDGTEDEIDDWFDNFERIANYNAI